MLQSEIGQLDNRDLLPTNGRFIDNRDVLAFLPSAWMQTRTWCRLCCSYRSTVWKHSWSGTPNALACLMNNSISSICLNANFGACVNLRGLTLPGCKAFAILRTNTEPCTVLNKHAMSVADPGGGGGGGPLGRPNNHKDHLKGSLL